VLSLANLVMVATMTMAPVQMRMHDDSGLGLVGLVVSAHIAAMFAPSALSGRLVDRYGDRAATLTSCLLLAAATGVAALSGTSSGMLFVAMVLLGLGWNAATVTGSAMLTREVPLRQRARLEGRGEIGMGVAAAMGGGLSGVVMDAGGYPALATVGLGVVVFALLPLGIRRTPATIISADCTSSSPSAESAARALASLTRTRGVASMTSVRWSVREVARASDASRRRPRGAACEQPGGTAP
jgi:MFS family permease